MCSIGYLSLVLGCIYFSPLLPLKAVLGKLGIIKWFCFLLSFFPRGWRSCLQDAAGVELNIDDVDISSSIRGGIHVSSCTGHISSESAERPQQPALNISRSQGCKTDGQTPHSCHCNAVRYVLFIYAAAVRIHGRIKHKVTVYTPLSESIIHTCKG